MLVRNVAVNALPSRGVFGTQPQQVQQHQAMEILALLPVTPSEVLPTYTQLVVGALRVKAHDFRFGIASLRNAARDNVVSRDM